MPVAQTLFQNPPAVHLALDRIIIEHVECREVIRDLELIQAVMTDISGRNEFKSSSEFATAGAISQSIHRLIHAGQLVGIDCETPFSSFTLVMPAGSKAIIALPVYVKYAETRH